MRSDVEIARAARLKPIAEIAAKIGAPESALHPFGRSIAKLEYDFLRNLGKGLMNTRPNIRLRRKGNAHSRRGITLPA